MVLRDFAGVPTKFATCAVLRDVDAENIFYSRVACARFLPNFGHFDDDTKRAERESKKKVKKKERTHHHHQSPPHFCFFCFFCPLSNLLRASPFFAALDINLRTNEKERERVKEKKHDVKRSWRRSGRTTTPTTPNWRRTTPSEEEKDKEK